jgi:hypothetical protein
MGLGGAKRIIGRWGFRGKALLTDVRFEGPGPWKGMVGMLDPAGFGKDRLPPIARRSGAFAVGSFRGGMDPASWATLRGMVRADYRPQLEVAERAISDAKNRRSFEELVKHLGPAWCLYASPRGNGSESAVPTLLIDVKDVEALDRALDSLATRLNAYFREQEFGDAGVPAANQRPATLALERLPAPERGYRVTSPAKRVPWLTDDLHPTVLLGRKVAVIAANPALARAAAAAESPDAELWKPAGEASKSFECLPARPPLLIVGNPRDSSWPEGIANLPKTAAPFLGKFVGADGGALADAPRSGLLSLFGVGRPVDPTDGEGRAGPIRAADLRARIFPSTFSATLDDRGVRFLSLEAMPFGCVWLQAKYEGKGLANPLTLKFKIGPGE